MQFSGSILKVSRQGIPSRRYGLGFLGLFAYFFDTISSMEINTDKLNHTIKAIFQEEKGVLAADESVRSTPKRLDLAGLENTEENRRRMRDLFLNTPGLEGNISGVILHDETFWQSNLDEQLFTEQLQAKGIVPGIKVDGGLKDLPGSWGEFFTQGLDNLEERLEQYAAGGAGFAKWRAAFHINSEEGKPSANAIRVNSNQMAIYAGLCQRQAIVPMVEPEVLITGTYSAQEKEEVMRVIFADLFMILEKHGVYLPGVILKTSMVHSAREAEAWATAEEVGERTAALLEQEVPTSLGGIVFLSGGLSGSTANTFLNSISQKQSEAMNAKTSFSFARAAQEEPLHIWAGEDANLAKARERFLEIVAKQGRAEVGTL